MKQYFIKINGILNEVESIGDNVFEASKIIEIEKIKERERILKLVDELKDPYPIDIFPEVKLSETGTKKLSKFFRNEIGASLDGFSASLIREARENLKEELKDSVILQESEVKK